jgi:L-threonylcarbamoyladenylate synthase
MPPASFTTSTPSSLQRALAAIERGEVILFPTETVYGLGVDSGNAAAVDRLYELKGRPKIKPFQWLISDVALARATSAWSPAAEKLAAAFWPGPLTLVVQLSSNAEETRGWRIPDHAWVLELLTKLGRPLVATSANRAGEPAALNFEEAMKTIGN